MSCCGKQKAERMKTFKYASILARQTVGVTRQKQAIIIINSRWGRHYDIMNYEKAQEQQKEIVQSYINSKKKKTPKGVAEFLE